MIFTITCGIIIVYNEFLTVKQTLELSYSMNKSSILYAF